MVQMRCEGFQEAPGLVSWILSRALTGTTTSEALSLYLIYVVTCLVWSCIRIATSASFLTALSGSTAHYHNFKASIEAFREAGPLLGCESVAEEGEHLNTEG